MKRTQFPVILAGILVVGWAGWGILGLVLAALGLGVSYYAAIRVHPRIRHVGFRGCGGGGEHKGSIYTWRFRKCPRCNSGRLISWGAGHYGAGHIQAEYQRSRGARKAARDGGRWR